MEFYTYRKLNVVLDTIDPQDKPFNNLLQWMLNIAQIKNEIMEYLIQFKIYEVFENLCNKK